jgi:hypothetical protein
MCLTSMISKKLNKITEISCHGKQVGLDYKLYYSLIGEFSKINFILQNYNEVDKSII